MARGTVPFIEPCLPKPASAPPSGSGWIHEIKHDGYRLMARRDGAGIRLITRNGNDWTERYPAIGSAVNALKVKSCLIDGEVVVCDVDGMADFSLLRRGGRIKPDAHLFAFDLLELDGVDLRRHPIEDRKTALAKLLRKAQTGLQLCEHIDAPGGVVFAHASAIGCEGIVSKRLGSHYVSGRTDVWVKTKNPASPAVKRESEEDWNGDGRRPKVRSR